jgi:hypothetical protein
MMQGPDCIVKGWQGKWLEHTLLEGIGNRLCAYRFFNQLAQGGLR